MPRDHERDIEKGGILQPPRLSDQIYQAFPNEPMVYGMDPEDGMPRPAVATSVQQAEAPPYSLDNLVCAEDTRRFVVRNKWGTVVSEWKPEQVEQTPNGTYRVRVERQRWGLVLLPLIGLVAMIVGAERTDGGIVIGGAVCFLLAVLAHSWRATEGARWLEVEPIRPRCRHYVRKLQEHAADADHTQIWRMCTAQKDSEGEFISVTDQWMLGCDQREPSDETSRVRLRIFDEKAEEMARQAEEDQAPVDLGAELAAQADKSEIHEHLHDDGV